MFPHAYRRRRRVETSWAGVLDTFHALVHKASDTGGCWLFMGPKEKGYGLIRYRAANGRVARLFAHDVAMAERLGRFLSPFEYVGHRCKNSCCVNADHLFICTDGLPEDHAPTIAGTDLTSQRRHLPGNIQNSDAQATEAIGLFFGPDGGGSVARVTPGIIAWTIGSLCRRYGTSRPHLRKLLYHGQNTSTQLAEAQIQEARQLFFGPAGAGSISTPRSETARWRPHLIAKHLGVSTGSVLKIVRGHSFTHLARPKHAELYVSDVLPVDRDKDQDAGLSSSPPSAAGGSEASGSEAGGSEAGGAEASGSEAGGSVPGLPSPPEGPSAAGGLEAGGSSGGLSAGGPSPSGPVPVGPPPDGSEGGGSPLVSCSGT